MYSPILLTKQLISTMLTTKIKEIRREKGLTQTYMANVLSVSQAAYQKLETGQIRLKRPVLEKIASVFEMSIQDIESYKMNNAMSVMEAVPEQQAVVDFMRIIDPTLKELIHSYKSRIEYLEKENSMLLEKLVG